jgi:hypothetical protein
MDREDSGTGEDMTIEVEVIEREPEGVVLTRHWTGDGAASSSRVGGVCKIGVFKRSHHVCKSRL